jgi:hypothetical protein
MNLLAEILKENSRYNVNRVVRIIEEDPDLIKELVSLTLMKDVRIPSRASWILSHCNESMPGIVAPFAADLIKALPFFQHTGTRRNILKIFTTEPIPEDYQVFMFDHCLEWVISKKEPIAVKAYAMDILVNIAMQEPDLKNEVIPVILDVMPHGSAGVKARGIKMLKKLGFKEEDYL